MTDGDFATLAHGNVVLVPHPASSDRPSEAAIVYLVRLAAGDTSPEVLAWMRSGLLHWLRSDGLDPLSARLHLGRTPRRTRTAARDLWINEAALYVGGSAWARAKALQAAAAKVRPKLGAWSKLSALPADVAPVQLCLAHGAIVSGIDLPRTIQAFYGITKGIARTP